MVQPGSTESVIPLFPCGQISSTLDFYETLGFEVTHRQESPYPYGAVRHGRIELHFSHLGAYGAKNSFGAFLVLVPDVRKYHRSFADGLRARYGKIPTAGLPRLQRLQEGQTRFKLFDPAGNVIIFINYDEPEANYGTHEGESSAMALALENAFFLRDTYANDKAAARVLDRALQYRDEATPLDIARALAARAELAVAMGEMEHARTLRLELAQIPLSDEEQERYAQELRAATDLEAWITTAGG